VDTSRIPEEPFEGLVFAGPHDAKHSSQSEGEGIVTSQIDYLKKLADHLLAEAEEQPSGERIPGDTAEDIWKEMLEDRPNWISTHEPDGIWEYGGERRELFPLPIK
jgi:hypothetical protein